MSLAEQRVWATAALFLIYLIALAAAIHGIKQASREKADAHTMQHIEKLLEQDRTKFERGVR